MSTLSCRRSGSYRPERSTSRMGTALAALAVAAGVSATQAGCSGTPTSGGNTSGSAGSATGSTGPSGETAGVTAGESGAFSGTGGVSTGSSAGIASGDTSGDTTGSAGATGTGSGASTGISGSASGSGSGSGTAGSSTGALDSGGASGSGASGSGSGGSGSGPGDGGPVASGDGGAAAQGCAGTSYKLCEDFETGTVGALPTGWTSFKGYGAGSPTDVALANDEFHSGKMSLKSDSLMRGATRAERSLSAIGATAANHWGRIFYKVDSPSPKPNTYLHNTFVSLIGPGGENRIVDTVEAPNGNTHQWLFNIPSDGCCTSSAYSWTFDAAWHCAEWYVDVATYSYRFFSDSTEVTALAFTGNMKSTMSDYTDVVVGATYYQSNGAIATPFIVWFDDLAIDDNRVGCQ